MLRENDKVSCSSNTATNGLERDTRISGAGIGYYPHPLKINGVSRLETV